MRRRLAGRVRWLTSGNARRLRAGLSGRSPRGLSRGLAGGLTRRLAGGLSRWLRRGLSGGALGDGQDAEHRDEEDGEQRHHTVAVLSLLDILVCAGTLSVFHSAKQCQRPALVRNKLWHSKTIVPLCNARKIEEAHRTNSMSRFPSGDFVNFYCSPA
jgi:hypothetical protein